MEWKKEKEVLQSEADREKISWFIPEMGEYKIKFLSEGEEFLTYPFDKRDSKNEAEKTFVKVKFDIEVDGKRMIWSIAKGKTFSSLYGQIVCLGFEWNGLTGKEVTLVVKGHKKDKSYTIIESIRLQGQLTKPLNK